MVRPLPLVLIFFYLIFSAIINILIGSLQSFALDISQFIGFMGIVSVFFGFFCFATAYGLWSFQAWGLQGLVMVALAQIAMALISMIWINNFFGLKSQYLTVWAIVNIFMGLYMIYISQQPYLSALYSGGIPDVGFRFRASEGAPQTKALTGNTYLLSAILNDGSVVRAEVSGRKARQVIGRDASDSDISLRDGTISRRHALIELKNDLLWVSDLGSTNGTKINSSPVGREPVIANAGDSIIVGTVKVSVSRG